MEYTYERNAQKWMKYAQNGSNVTQIYQKFNKNHVLLEKNGFDVILTLFVGTLCNNLI